ncbi:MAG: hypothetical protein G01um10143_1, partial [Parcubacteria group bacterium Gr01-1014_3]
MKGIIYIMTTAVSGLIKIGQTGTNNYQERMRNLEANGYYNVAGLKRFFAIELEDYAEKEALLHDIFNKHQVGESELFALDQELIRQLLLSFKGKVIYGYKDSAEEGVEAYDGKLDIRPKYQREFVYKEKQRNAVMETIKNSFPLNVMYWMIRDDGGYEVLDGQQRTISIGQYVTGDFSLNDRFFHNLTKEEQDKILDYELMIYFCEGTDKERLDWFRIINIAGEKLTDQEIRNAVYTGSWLSDAKIKFSKSNCAAYLLANDGGSLV